MKKKRVLSLFIAASLLNNYTVQAISTHSIVAISEAIAHGASSGNAIGGVTMTAALVGPHLMRFGTVQAIGLANIAISWKIKKDTSQILKNLSALSEAVRSNFKRVHADIAEHAVQSSQAHKKTHDDIAALHKNVDRINVNIATGNADLARQIHALQSKVVHGNANIEEVKRLVMLQNIHIKQVLSRIKTLEENQKTSNFGIASLLTRFTTK